MSGWVFKGLETGIKTTGYPEKTETAPGVSPGFPAASRLESDAAAEKTAASCPTQALSTSGSDILVDAGRCVHCFRCAREAEAPVTWEMDYEWGRMEGEPVRAFSRSLNVFVVDAGDCGACYAEIKQLNSPYYNMHRLGFFITPTPRNADLLLVIGPVTDAMRNPLRKAYDAMPTPKMVMAVGACGCSGGVFGPSFASASGAENEVPVDIFVPGCPPPPLAILHGLLASVGKKRGES